MTDKNQNQKEKFEFQKSLVEIADMGIHFDANDFSKNINEQISQTEKFVEENKNIPPELLNQYFDRVNEFLQKVDSENFDKLRDEVVGDLHAIYTEMVGVTALNTVREKRDKTLEDAEKGLESTEKSADKNILETTIDEKKYDLTNIEEFVHAYNAVGKMEQHFQQDYEKLFNAFSDAQKTIEAANQEVEEENDSWIPFKGAWNWAASKLGSKSESHRAAESALGNIREKFETDAQKIEEGRAAIAHQRNLLEAAAWYFVKTAEERAKDGQSDGAELLAEVKNQKDQVCKSFQEIAEMNGQIIDQIRGQEMYLKEAQVKDFTFGSSCLKSIPVIGKIGVAGVLEGVGKGANWLGNKIHFHPLKLIDKGVDLLGEKTKNVWGLSVLGGALVGTKDLAGGLLTAVTNPTETVDGIISLAGSPSRWKEVGKALIHYDEFAAGNFGYGAGKAIPDALLLAFSGGASAGLKGASLGTRVAATTGRIWEMGKYAAWTLPKNIALAPFRTVAGVGRMFRAFGKGLSWEELKLYIRNGKNGLDEFIKKQTDELKRLDDAQNFETQKLQKKYPNYQGPRNNQYLRELDELNRYYKAEKLKITDTAAKSSDALNKLSGQTVASPKGTLLPEWKTFNRRKLKQRSYEKQQEIKTLEADPAKNAQEIQKLNRELDVIDAQIGEARTVWGPKFKPRIPVGRRQKIYKELYKAEYAKEAELIELAMNRLKAASDWKGLAQANETLSKLRWKFGKEALKNFKGVYALRKLFQERLKVLGEGFLDAKNAGLALWKEAPQLGKTVMQTLSKTMKEWTYWPPKMFDILFQPSSLSIGQRIEKVFGAYPQLKTFVEGYRNRPDAFTVEEFTKQLVSIREKETLVASNLLKNELGSSDDEEEGFGEDFGSEEGENGDKKEKEEEGFGENF